MALSWLVVRSAKETLSGCGDSSGTTPNPLDVRVTRVFFFDTDKTDADRWAYREIGKTRGLRGCGVRLPEERWVFVADDGEAYVVGRGADGFEASISPQPYFFFSNVKAVPPGRAYAVGPRRKVFVRNAPDTCG
jgi:hypothetical protein